MRVVIDKDGHYRATVLSDVTLADGFSIVEIPDDTVGLHDGCTYINGVMTGCIADREHSFEIVPDRSELILKEQIASERERLLRDNVDAMNPMRWLSMSQEKQAEWVEYRQELLDVTKQDGYPKNVAWPIKPI